MVEYFVNEKHSQEVVLDRLESDYPAYREKFYLTSLAHCDRRVIYYALKSDKYYEFVRKLQLLYRYYGRYKNNLPSEKNLRTQILCSMNSNYIVMVAKHGFNNIPNLGNSPVLDIFQSYYVL